MGLNVRGMSCAARVESCDIVVVYFGEMDETYESLCSGTDKRCELDERSGSWGTTIRRTFPTDLLLLRYHHRLEG